MTNPSQDLEAKMRERARELRQKLDNLPDAYKQGADGGLYHCLSPEAEEAITQALLEVAQRKAKYREMWQEAEAELAQARAERDRAERSFSHVAQCLRAAICYEHRAARDTQGGTIPWPEQGECLACQLAQARADLEKVTASRKQFLKDVSDDMECLPYCNRYGHEDNCPVVNTAAAWRNLRAEIDYLRTRNAALMAAVKG